MATYDPELQKRLDKLWFRLPTEAKRQEMGLKEADLALRQKWLVRIFQSCAREEFGAREDPGDGAVSAERLTRVPIAPGDRLPKSFIPHGHVDTATRNAMAVWEDENKRLRCPVIFQARLKRGKNDPKGWSKIVEEGFFFHDELRLKEPRVFARDFTSANDTLPGGKPPLIVVGTATSWGKEKKPRWGIQAKEAHTLRGVSHFNPHYLIGKEWDELTATEQSNFRVISAIAGVEAGGNFDGMNAYDTSVLSIGPYNYTACPVDTDGVTQIGPAELGAFLAYWETRGISEYPVFRDSLGVAPMAKWSAALRLDFNRTYAAEIGFADTAGKFVQVRSTADYNYLRTYYLFYRFQEALRFRSSMKYSFWPYARQRVADLLTTPWTDGAPPGAGKIGDVFKSERSIAMLLRWHVYRPSHVIYEEQAGKAPSRIVKAAKLDKKKVSTWTHDDELKLIKAFSGAGLASLRSPDLTTSLGKLLKFNLWPDSATKPGDPSLKTSRDFVMDTAEIPFPGGSA